MMHGQRSLLHDTLIEVVATYLQYLMQNFSLMGVFQFCLPSHPVQVSGEPSNSSQKPKQNKKVGKAGL